MAGVSPDGTIGVSGSGDESACLFPLAAGTDDCVELKGHSDSIIDVKFNTSGTLLATASLDSTIRVWDVSNGSLVRILEGPSGEIEWCEWHTKADIVLAGAADGTCWMWDASRGDCMQVFAGHEDSVTCGGFTLNGKKIVTGSMDGSTRLWSPKTGMCMHTFTGHGWHQGGIVCTALHPSQPTVIVGGVDGTARIARLDTKKILGTLDHAHAVPRLLGAAGTSTRRKQQMEEGACSVEAVSFCDVQDICCTGGTDGEIKIWDIKTMQCKQACTHEDAVTVAQFIPGTCMVLSASMDGTVRVWDARNGNCIKTLLGHRNGILDARFVQGTRLVVTASDDHTSRVFRFKPRFNLLKT